MDIFEHVLRMDGFSDFQNSLSATRSQGGADLQNAPCVIGWVSGSVQPAANAHFRLISKKK